MSTADIVRADITRTSRRLRGILIFASGEREGGRKYDKGDIIPGGDEESLLFTLWNFPILIL